MTLANVWNPFSGESPPPIDVVDHDIRPTAKVNGFAATALQDAGSEAIDLEPRVEEIHANPWYRQAFGNFEVSESPLYRCVRKLRIIGTGAGVTGIHVAYKLSKLLEDVDLILYDKNDAIGGTWLENKYPGCACDIPSHVYQFSWHRNPDWSSFYSPSSEILDYLRRTVEKFDLGRFFKLGHRVIQCDWNDDRGKWVCRIQRSDGTTFVDEADVLLNTSGALNVWKYPEVPGMETFKGKLMHTAFWDGECDLQDKTVAVIGSGSSAVQVVPNIAPKVKLLLNFVRSPVWLSPGFAASNAGPDGSNFRYTEEQKSRFRNDPKAYEEYTRNIEEDLARRFPQQHEKSDLQTALREAMKLRMRRKIGDDRIADYIIPSFGLGCRRLSPGDEYMASMTRENVRLVQSGVVRVTENGVIDDQGKEHLVDIIVCATGFDTNFAPTFPIKGREGVDLKTFYGKFPRGYLSIMTPHFPNFYQFTGPGAPGSHGPFFAIMEWLTRYMLKTLVKMQKENIKSLEPSVEATVDYYNWCHTMFKRLVYSQPCASWYKNGNRIGPVTAQYPGSRLHWCELLREPRYEDFSITYLSNNKFQFLGNGFTQNDVEGTDLTWWLDAPEI